MAKLQGKTALSAYYARTPVAFVDPVRITAVYPTYLISREIISLEMHCKSDDMLTLTCLKEVINIEWGHDLPRFTGVGLTIEYRLQYGHS